MITYRALNLNYANSLSLTFTFNSNPRCLTLHHFTSPLRNKFAVYTSIDRTAWNSSNFSSDSHKSRSRNGFEGGGGGGEERKVNCEVEVISWRERRIKAEISVNADIESVWDALTDYERLADFVPNLVSRLNICHCNNKDKLVKMTYIKAEILVNADVELVWDALTEYQRLADFVPYLVFSERIPCPHPGRIWLEQRGLQRALYWHIEARVVLDLQEFPKSANEHELHFSMVDGDFKKFEGKWCVQSGKRSSTTTLSYKVNVIPRFSLPSIFLERIICLDLPVNLQALACRAEKNFNPLHTTSLASLTPARIDIDGAISKEIEPSPGELKENYASSSFGPLSPPVSELNSSWGVFGKSCQLDKHCMVDEVHLRRFDGLLEDGGVHRCVVASIMVKAPVREVWNVLTAYESLPEIVPNLAISKIVSRENNKVRILQEGCKGLLYMVLHARVVLDLCEHLEQEISFVQVEGDFDSFQGKWLLEQLGNHHTLLKYTVESKMHKNSLLSEAIMEEVIYEDLPSNLCSIRDYIEKREAENSQETRDPVLYTEKISSYSNGKSVNHIKSSENVSVSNGLHPSRQRPRVPGLQRNIEVLKAELLAFILEHGQEGFMPMRKQLRKHGRVDIEKAITRMGGFRRIASLMNLSLAYKLRKPKGYWDNLENLEEEINRFQRSWGMDPSFMPSRKTFERAGRYDIARALEKWGGLHEVSRLLSLKVRHPNRQVNLANKDKKNEYVVASNNVNGEDMTPPKPYVSQDTEKWFMKLKDLDINWVE